MANIAASVAKIWAAKKLYQYLSKGYEEMPIFKAGIIDKSGRVLIKTKDLTAQQKRMFGPFEKMLLLVKRTLKKHGVHSLALAVTFLEEQQYDEFWSYVSEKAEECDDLDDLDLEEIDEDAGTTTTANIAGTAFPLGSTMVRRKKADVSGT
jgi:hypothetical protein